MFSIRALVSAALLALVASTSANPLQFSDEQYRFPWVNCEYSGTLPTLLLVPNPMLNNLLPSNPRRV